MLETGELGGGGGLGAHSKIPQSAPGAEPRKILEIFTSPNPWKSFRRYKTLSIELLFPLKPVHFSFWGNMGMREKAGGIFLCRNVPNAGGLATMQNNEKKNRLAKGVSSD